MARLTTVDEILRLIDAPRGADVAAAAIFDADGTIWSGDIGDTAFERAGELVLPATWTGPVRAFCDRYGFALPDDVAALARVLRSPEHAARARSRMSDDEWHDELYGLHAWVYAGQPRAHVARLGTRIFADGFAHGVFDEMLELIAQLRTRGIKVAIVSASPGALVEALVQAASLEVDAVFGMEPAVDAAGLALPSLGRSTYAAGKVRAVRSWLGDARPLLAFGDSVLGGDRALLAHAHIPVAVNTGGSHRAAALADARMLLLDPK